MYSWIYGDEVEIFLRILGPRNPCNIIFIIQFVIYVRNADFILPLS
jgi:hypothetical protein